MPNDSQRPGAALGFFARAVKGELPDRTDEAIPYVVAGLVLIVGAVFLCGYHLPARTTITHSITLKEKPVAVFAAFADVQHLAEWNRNTEKVELLQPTAGRKRRSKLSKAA